MNTCKDCKHWGQGRNYKSDEGRRLKSCSAPAFLYGYNCSENDVPDNGAAIEDDEGWGMQTGPDFGCVNWEEKPVLYIQTGV